MTRPPIIGAAESDSMRSSTLLQPNGLLAQLPSELRTELAETFVPVDLLAGQMLYDTNEKHNHIYFPLSGVISLVHLLETGEMGEVAMAGREGMVGVSLLVDSHAVPSRAIVQVAGKAIAIPADVVTAHLRKAQVFQVLMLRYTQALMAQMAQITMCSRRHTVEKQLCRWLLTCWDRIDDVSLRMTHDAIANALCVRRGGVTEAARKLQEAGLIQCGRSSITLLDRSALEARACECYMMIRREVERLVGMSIPVDETGSGSRTSEPSPVIRSA
jgi:CRP-like cAMP-binding protein